jgi:hypothetical protein
MSKKLYDVEITICPELLTKQRNFLFDIADEDSEEWSDERMEAINGLINMLDAIEDQIHDLTH